MVLSFKHQGRTYQFNTSEPIDISLAVKRNTAGANCFYTEKPVYKFYQSGGFTGNVALGGVCNVDIITFTPHGNGTHTECIGHINAEGRTIIETLNESFCLAKLISVNPEKLNEDLIISLQQVIDSGMEAGVEAFIVRTVPNDDSKKIRDYSGTNPVYFSADALKLLNESGVKHLLCDIPSVDREDDGGKLLAHKAFFGVPDAPRLDATITELVYVPSTIEDGLYMLNLQIAPFESDASPSRPLLFKITED